MRVILYTIIINDILYIYYKKYMIISLFYNSETVKNFVPVKNQKMAIFKKFEYFV